MVRLLLEHGAKVNVRDVCYKQTPLHYAIFKTDQEFCELLLMAGADVSLEDVHCDSALDDVALNDGIYLSAKFIAEKSDPVDIFLALAWSLPRYQHDAPRNLKLLMTILCSKCASENLTASALYAKLARTPTSNKRAWTKYMSTKLGSTLLHLAMDASSPDTDIIEFLLSTKFDYVNQRDTDGLTALDMAVCDGHDAVAEVLRRHGAY